MYSKFGQVSGSISNSLVGFPSSVPDLFLRLLFFALLSFLLRSFSHLISCFELPGERCCST